MNRTGCSTFLAATGVLLALVQACHGQTNWPWLKLTLITNTPVSVTHLTHAGDGSGRLFIVKQHGQIQVIDRDGHLLPTPFLDITDRLGPFGFSEAGLLSVAFPPGFKQKRYFYVAYADYRDRTYTVSRFFLAARSTTLANPHSEQVILTNLNTRDRHYGGQLAFGPDGYLYISHGEGGRDELAQRLDSINGKLLRIDTESPLPRGSTNRYLIPPTNPFVGVPHARPEIWALGLRNPWRFSFDRQSGDLYIGDVGADTREEVNFQPAHAVGGVNYGWPYWEGTQRWNHLTIPPETSPLTAPAIDFGRNDGGVVIGGHVYRGPSQLALDGVYLFSNLGADYLWGLKRVGTNWLRDDVGPQSGYITTFGEDEAGRLFLGNLQGSVYRLDHSLATPPPRFDPKGYKSREVTGGQIVFTDNIRVTGRAPGDVVRFVRYTYGSRLPTESDPVVPENGIIVITNGTAIAARAWRPGLAQSEPILAIFYLQSEPPQYDPPSGDATNGMTIAISCQTPQAVIYYTLDGSEPTSSSSIYTQPIRLELDALHQIVRLRARSVRSSFPDGLSDATYSLPVAGLPRFVPPAGPIYDGTPISIISDSPGATIHFETNGSPATISSPVYTNPVVLDGGSRISALATRDDLRPSVSAVAIYSRAQETNFGRLTFSAAQYQVDESNRTATINVVRTGATNLLARVALMTTGGSASDGLDFVATNVWVEFPPGSAGQSFALTLLPDSAIESTETITLALRVPTDAFLGTITNAQISIIDDDLAGRIEFSATKYNLIESQPNARIVVQRTGGQASDVGVHCYAVPISATDGGAFIAFDTNLVFAAGETQRAIEIPLLDDHADHAADSFAVYLDSPTGGATIGARASAVVTLRDDDPTSRVQFARPAVRVKESDATAALIISRTGDASESASVFLAASSETAWVSVDLLDPSQVVSFAPGERSKVISVSILNDDEVEERESVFFELMDPRSVRLGTAISATLVIEDDEIRVLGSYRISGTFQRSECNGSPSIWPFAGRLDVLSQLGSNFTGHALMLGTDGRYAYLMLTGIVNSAQQITGSFQQTNSSGETVRGTIAGDIHTTRMRLAFTNEAEVASCRWRGKLMGVREPPAFAGWAPTDLAGHTLFFEPRHTSGSFIDTQPYHIEFTSGDECIVTSDTAQFPPAASRYVFTQLGLKSAALQLADGQSRTYRFSLTFSGPATGAFSGKATTSSQIGQIRLGP